MLMPDGQALKAWDVMLFEGWMEFAAAGRRL